MYNDNKYYLNRVLITIKMIWIYILKCEDDIYYVGQTKRLFRRFWEHEEGNGGTNTSIYNPIEIVAIYKVFEVRNFIEYNKYVNKINSGIWHNEYDNRKLKYYNNNVNVNSDEILDNENNIAECMMIHNKNKWKNIRGGKYIRFDCNYKFPDDEYLKELPLCNCGLPCDIKKHKNKESLYFRCAKNNMWDDFKESFDIEDEPCKFFREYLTDIELRIEAKKNINSYNYGIPKGKCLIKF